MPAKVLHESVERRCQWDYLFQVHIKGGYNLQVRLFCGSARNTLGRILLFGMIAGLVWVSMTMLTGCNDGPKPMGMKVDPSHVAKIKVNREGVISLNDQPVTIDELKSSLLKISQSPGSGVWYYRENPAGEPHPNAMLVLSAIVESKLPVRLSTKPDFSDSVGPGSTSQPPR